MDKRVKRTIIICDTDLDHSFTLEGMLKNHNYDVVNISDATELVSSVQSLHPSVVLANPDMQGFNENDVCQKIKLGLGIPVILLLEGNSTHRAQLGTCQADDVITKPDSNGNIIMLIKKHISLQQQ
ncbi:MAG TPA: response regulator [Flavisolibacter sp.]|nr:response regulator [Flavisolibacter sp.]